MSRLVAVAATVLAAVLALVSVQFLLGGQHFLAGTVLTFVAFSLYVREMNTS